MSVWYCPENNKLIVKDAPGRFVVEVYTKRGGWFAFRWYELVGEL